MSPFKFLVPQFPCSGLASVRAAETIFGWCGLLVKLMVSVLSTGMYCVSGPIVSARVLFWLVWPGPILASVVCASVVEACWDWWWSPNSRRTRDEL